MRCFVFACLVKEVSCGAAACQDNGTPNGYSTAPYNHGNNECPADKPAILSENAATSGDDAVAQTQLDNCCKVAPACSTRYENNGGSTANYVQCAANQFVVGATLCLTHDGSGKCGKSGVAADDVTIDTARCCKKKCSEGVGLSTDNSKDTKCTDATKVPSLTLSCTSNAAGTACAAGDLTTCCVDPPKCSDGFVLSTGGTVSGSTDTGNKVLCDAGQIVSTTASCSVKASSLCTSAADKATCCLTKCDATTAGWDVSTGSKTLKCDAGHTVAAGYCAATDCTGSKAVCCQKSCSDGMALPTKTDAQVTADAKLDFKCSNKDVTKISEDLKCAKSTCDTSDEATCCLSTCETRFQAKGGTDKMSDTTTKKTECAEGETVATGVFCSTPGCDATADADTCCLTKCDAEKGWEAVSGDPAKGSDDKKSDCDKDLQVHKTGNCKGRDCSGSKSVCCQQKCTAGFKLKDATTDETNECGEGLTVHETEWCAGNKCGTSDAKTCCQQKCSKGFKADGATTDESNTCPKQTTVSADVKCTGSPCNEADDEKLCCNVKCTDAKTGFQLAAGTGDQELFCKKGETLAESKECDGDCSDDDASTCCLSQNNSTGSTTDANGVGLAAAVGLLIILSVAS